ncbi:hypothetical protein B0H14DRAFT_3617644 [Mycena olivaceomarginata]|nr:hypothetical protein B0H14DRAFT_3617644 [Mycena olivaceomarginata]
MDWRRAPVAYRSPTGRSWIAYGEKRCARGRWGEAGIDGALLGFGMLVWIGRAELVEGPVDGVRVVHARPDAEETKRGHALRRDGGRADAVELLVHRQSSIFFCTNNTETAGVCSSPTRKFLGLAEWIMGVVDTEMVRSGQAGPGGRYGGFHSRLGWLDKNQELEQNSGAVEGCNDSASLFFRSDPLSLRSNVAASAFNLLANTMLVLTSPLTTTSHPTTA